MVSSKHPTLDLGLDTLSNQKILKGIYYTLCAQSCTAHQMEIFAQKFEPACYFCDWTSIHLGMRRQK